MSAAAADLRLAHELADCAAQIALERRGEAIERSVKPDGSIVTSVDLEIEDELLALLATARPDDHVLTEERGAVGPPAARRWLLDPIDGTEDYLGGGRAWGTHVALEVCGVLEVAVLTRPAVGRRWWAARGGGAFDSDGRRLRLAQTRELAHARVAGLVEARSSVPAALAARAEWVDERTEGCVITALLDGRIDGLVDEGGEPWDRAPVLLLTVEAGGCWRCTDADPLTAARVAYANPQLADALHACVAGGH